MSIDRRIVSILYYNNITDINNVEEFIGEKNGYYDIKINGKIKSLKIPDNEYTKRTKITTKVTTNTTTNTTTKAITKVTTKKLENKNKKSNDDDFITSI